MNSPAHFRLFNLCYISPTKPRSHIVLTTACFPQETSFWGIGWPESRRAIVCIWSGSNWAVISSFRVVWQIILKATGQLILENRNDCAPSGFEHLKEWDLQWWSLHNRAGTPRALRSLKPNRHHLPHLKPTKIHQNQSSSSLLFPTALTAPSRVDMWENPSGLKAKGISGNFIIN